MQEFAIEMSLEFSLNEFKQFIEQIKENYLGSIIDISNKNSQVLLQTIEKIRQYMPPNQITQKDIDTN